MTSRIRHRGEHHDLTAPRTRRATGSMIITFRPRLLAFCHSTDLKMKYALTSGMRGGSRKHDTILRHAEFHRAKSVKSSIFRWNTLIRREYGCGEGVLSSPQPSSPLLNLFPIRVSFAGKCFILDAPEVVPRHPPCFSPVMGLERGETGDAVRERRCFAEDSSCLDILGPLFGQVTYGKSMASGQKKHGKRMENVRKRAAVFLKALGFPS